MRRTLYGEDHEAFRTLVRQYVEREITPNRENFMRHGAISREAWLAAGSHGLLGLGVPEEYGGSNAMDYRFNAVLDEELTRPGLAYSAAFGLHTHVIANYLVRLADQEQRERWLHGFCSGEIVTAIAMTEPSGGSDLAALRTRADADGRDWILSGSKTFITNGFSADLVVVAARTLPGSRSKGISLFVVEAGMRGFERGRKLDKVGQREGDTAELFFDGVRVPRENILGEINAGFSYMMKHLPTERLASSICNVSHARYVLEDTIEYVRTRRAFGQTIGSMQHNRFLLADLMTSVDVAQSWVDSCVASHATGELSTTDASKAKLFTSEVQSRVVDACVQLHGGYGYIAESEVARAWQDARVTRIWAGTSEIMKEVIGRSLCL
jgi:alkylation response protein AidB-like acyl-CoA dehydrogenase